MLQKDRHVRFLHDSIFDHDLFDNHVTPLQSSFNAFCRPMKERGKLWAEYCMQHIQDKEIEDVSELTYSDFACMKAVCRFTNQGRTDQRGRDQATNSMYISLGQNNMFGYATRCMDLLLCKWYFSWMNEKTHTFTKIVAEDRQLGITDSQLIDKLIEECCFEFRVQATTVKELRSSNLHLLSAIYWYCEHQWDIDRTHTLYRHVDDALAKHCGNGTSEWRRRRITKEREERAARNKAIRMNGYSATPVSNTLAIAPPDGGWTTHRCAGDYLDYLISGKKPLPPVLSIIPLPVASLHRHQGDRYGTIYPGSDLPDGYLDNLGVKNTRSDGYWSTYVWGQLFFLPVLQFQERRKGRVISKGMTFTLAVFDHGQDGCFFEQDFMYLARNDRYVVPHKRQGFLKSPVKVVASALYEFRCDQKTGWYTGTKTHDPENRYAIRSIHFHKSLVVGNDIVEDPIRFEY